LLSGKDAEHCDINIWVKEKEKNTYTHIHKYIHSILGTDKQETALEVSWQLGRQASLFPSF
jgi:hypothetical protein